MYGTNVLFGRAMVLKKHASLAYVPMLLIEANMKGSFTPDILHLPTH